MVDVRSACVAHQNKGGNMYAHKNTMKSRVCMYLFGKNRSGILVTNSVNPMAYQANIRINSCGKIKINEFTTYFSQLTRSR